MIAIVLCRVITQRARLVKKFASLAFEGEHVETIIQGVTQILKEKTISRVRQQIHKTKVNMTKIRRQ